jgi:hypothetical protein
MENDLRMQIDFKDFKTIELSEFIYGFKGKISWGEIFENIFIQSNSRFPDSSRRMNS